MKKPERIRTRRKMVNKRSMKKKERKREKMKRMKDGKG
jgi:hypothetical protein